MALSNKKLTPELCQKWRKNKLINPFTDRKIKNTGAIYKLIEKDCSKIKSLDKTKDDDIVLDVVKKNIPNEINNKTVKEFIIKYIKKYNTVKELLEQKIITKDEKEYIDELNKYINGFSKSEKGFIYERIWDICIKFGITDFTNDVKKVKEVKHGIGNINNINKSEFIEFKNYIDKYLDEKYISGNSGGYSDITFSKKTEDEQNILNLISVKYYNKAEKIDKYDIQKLCTIIDDRKNDGYDIKVMLFVKDKGELIKNIKKANRSSDILIKYISPNGKYENIYDENDLEIYYSKLKSLLELYNYFETDEDYNKFKTEYLQSFKKLFIPRFHQELFIEKINDLINKDNKKILVGAIPRSGKTYIMAGTILEHVKNNIKSNFNKYIIITPAPTETILQYKEAFDNYINYDNYNIKAIIVDKDIDKYDFKSKNSSHIVYLISKQRLGYNKITDKNDNLNIENKKLEKIEENIKKYFKDINFDIIFMDEAHFGMSTKNAQSIIDILDTNDTPKVFVTATYNKPNIAYNISNHQKISWDLNDIKNIKNINENNFKENIQRFVKNFGKNILKKVLKNNGWIWEKEDLIDENIIKINDNIIKKIKKQYENFPQPYLITTVWDSEYIKTEKNKVEGTNFSFDMDKLFTPTKEKNIFENIDDLKEFFHYYFGYPDKNKCYKDQIFYKKRGILPRIQDICNNNCRTLQHPLHKTSQLWFLPYGQGREIKNVINSLLYFLQNNFGNIFKRHLFFVAIEKMDNAFMSDNVEYMSKSENIKDEILNFEKKLYVDKKSHNYDGLIILAGARLQLGISLPNVDIVSMFSGISSSDQIYQMMFRSMTEIDKDIECDDNSFCAQKKYGFMVDLNPQRTLITLNYLAEELIDKTKTDIDKKNIYNIIADLINIDRDVLISKYDDIKGDNKKYSDELFDKLYKSWDLKVENLKNIVKEIEYDSEFFKKLEQDNDVSKFFKLTKEKKTNDEITKPEDEINGKKISIENIYKQANKKKEQKLNLREMIDNIMTEVISLLTIITSYNDLECPLDKNKNIDDIDIKYEISKLLELVDKNDVLKNIFISGLKDRIINEENIDDVSLFNFIINIVNMMNTKNKKGGNLISINKIIQVRKEKIYTINEPDKLLEFIHQNLAPKDIEKKERGEVFTPMDLVNNMLGKLPKSVWKNKDYKWLDPVAGMGNFPIAVYIKLMESLKDEIPIDEERKKHILENMLYMVEINKNNVFMMKKILCGNKYKLNIFEGSFIDYKNKFSKINIEEKFDIIMANPPYQYKEKGKKTVPVWYLFVERSFNLINTNGYLLYIHPSGWRDIDGIYRKVFDYIKKNNLIYLSMNDFKTGSKVFSGVGTNFDYYVVQNKETKKNITEIKDIDDEIYKMDLNNFNFIPSGKINDFNKVIAKKGEKNVNILYSRSAYGSDKDNMSKNKNKVYKYPCCYTITQKNGMSFWYSKKIKMIGHFGVPKVIWSNGAGTYPIIDKDGKYGLTQFCYAIVDNKNKLEKIKEAMISKNFIKLMKYLTFKEDNKYNYKIIRLFKKDFYKYFINERMNKSLSLIKKSKSIERKNKSIG